MDEVFKFVETFREFPPRAFPPSFNPANIMEQTLREIRAGRKLREAFPFLPPPGSGSAAPSGTRYHARSAGGPADA